MRIAIQDVLVPHVEVERDLAACAAAKIPFVRFGLIPFTDDVTSDEPGDLEGEAVPFGSVKIIRLWQRGKTPGGWRIFYDEAMFNQVNWAKRIGDLALNYDYTAERLGSMHFSTWADPIFVKPANDLKAFAGMVIEPGETVSERLAKTTTDDSLADDEVVIMAREKPIIEEFRCYMHGSDMIEASRYKTADRATHTPTTDTERDELVDFSRAVAARHAPGRFYAVDVCRIPDGSLRVVEFNCINCSGRYAADRAKIFQAVIEGANG